MLENHEDIWKLHWVPTPWVHTSHSWFYNILVTFLWTVLLVYVSFKSCPCPGGPNVHDQQKSLKLDPMIGWMNSCSSCELDSIFKSLIPLGAHIKLTHSRTISKLFSHVICPSSAHLEYYQGYTVLVCLPVGLPLSSGSPISGQGLCHILWFQCLIQCVTQSRQGPKICHCMSHLLYPILLPKITFFKIAVLRGEKRRQATDWEKIHANDTADGGLLSIIYKERLKQFENKQQTPH